MEIYRTDGGGKSHYNKRLFDLVENISKEDSNILHSVIKINDHKGTLNVELCDSFNGCMIDVSHIYSTFNTFWYQENEYLINIIHKGIVIFGYDKGNIAS